MTHGFQSLAINKVELSYPAMLAEALGVQVPDFQIPSFLGKGGFPFNIERIARNLETHGDRIWAHEWPFALNDIVEMLDDVEDYWETGKGSKPSSDDVYHNLAVFGFQVGDAYNVDAKYCKDKIKKDKIKDPQHDIFPWPSEPRFRAAYRVLNPAQTPERLDDTQISVAKRIMERDGEIENLIV